MVSSRAVVAALLAFTYLSTATAALPVVCSMQCATAEGTGGKTCHRTAAARAGKSCHRSGASEAVQRCPMHQSRDGSGRCCAMSGGDHEAADQLLLSLIGTGFLVPQTTSLFQTPPMARVADAPAVSPLDVRSIPLTPPPRV
jgi:hypothetical protein